MRTSDPRLGPDFSAAAGLGDPDTFLTTFRPIEKLLYRDKYVRDQSILSVRAPGWAQSHLCSRKVLQGRLIGRSTGHSLSAS